MPETREIRVPDIGDFSGVPVIEIPVAPGETIARDQTLLIVESDKATLDIPAPVGGRLVEMLVGLGDTVSAGTLIARVSVETEAVAPAAAPEPAPSEGDSETSCDVLVIGGGPGGYAAAFRAADLGQRVILVEREATLGGVCLNVGCIPSKALLHVAAVTEEAGRLAAHGIGFGAPTIDLDKLRAFKAGTVRRLTDGLTQMARQRKVAVVRGTARFAGANEVSVALQAGV
ncbi:FAD-dependent oxidoreductase, partial [Methylobacterium sp. WL18]|uniref:biotin/lipoyl-containing protein n=1 Tax=Methylobacterium sp. WL18 TaxID=2603897 RepID=UPI0011C7EF4C